MPRNDWTTVTAQIAADQFGGMSLPLLADVLNEIESAGREVFAIVPSGRLFAVVVTRGGPPQGKVKK